jgi:integrase
MVQRAARAAGFDMKIHPHMLRHSCGYKLANDEPIPRLNPSLAARAHPSD